MSATTDKDRGMNDILRELEKMGNSGVKIGFIQGEQRPDGIPQAAIAQVHEYGVPKRNIPQRSFLRRWVVSNQAQINAFLESRYAAVAAGKMTADKALNQIGVYGVGGVKQTLLKLTSPALSPITIARKKSSKLLVDTGGMVNSIRHQVVNMADVDTTPGGNE